MLACRHLGPATVLEVLPLQLQQGLSGAGEARTWLLPALRRHVSGTQMRYWATHLMPLAKEMGQAAAAASQRGNKSVAAACHALEVQLWSCLQAFANWPTDAAEVYPGERGRGVWARVQHGEGGGGQGEGGRVGKGGGNGDRNVGRWGGGATCVAKLAA